MKKYFLLYFPFLIFTITYFFLIYYYQGDKLITPSFVGKILSDVLTESDSNNIVFKIVRVAYNNEYPDNYILGQYPLPGSLIRQSQIISLEINNNKNKIIETLLKDSIEECDLECIKDNYKKEGVQYKIIYVDTDIKSYKKVISVYDKNKNLTYIYVFSPLNNSKTYIKNCVKSSCLNFSKNCLLYCYQSDNNTIVDCVGRSIVNQFPLPGVYIKNKDIDKIHVWHK